MTRVVDVDYLVVGAGAMGMAFTDSLIDHADVRVAVADRRDGVGGHWLEAYPFVRLHQASAFYGVASTLLGGGRVQVDGPEAGLQERATGAEICVYYRRILDRLLASGKVEFFANWEYVGDRTVVSRMSGERLVVAPGCRIVDARYLAPDIPAQTPPPFDVARDARVVAGQRPCPGGPVGRSVRGRGVRQDRHRRVCVAPDPGRRRRRDLLGEAAGSVDAQPSCGPARSSGVLRHGGEHHGSGC